MARQAVLALASVAAVVSAAIVGTSAIVLSQTNSTSCTCSTVDLESGSVTLAVLSSGTAGSTSVSQQITQVNDHVRVQIDVEYDETSVEIAGKSVADGSLVLNVTRDGELVNESLAVDASETSSVAFHLEPDGIRITTNENECPCEDVDDVELDEPCADSSDAGEEGEVNVGNVVEDRNINAGNIDLNVPVLGSDDSSANATQIINDDNDSFQSQQNVGRDDGDSAKSAECSNGSLDGGTPSADISTSGRQSATAGTHSNVFRVVTRPHELAGLAMENADPRISLGGIISELRHELGTDEEP